MDKKKRLLITYKALGRSIVNYATPVWSTNASESNIGKEHLNLLSAQYLVHCLDTENVCHHITKMYQPPREIKETIFTRLNQVQSLGVLDFNFERAVGSILNAGKIVESEKS